METADLRHPTPPTPPATDRALTDRALAFGRRHLLYGVLSAYGIAFLLPAPGLASRREVLTRIHCPGLGAPMAVTLPTVLLAVLLFTAALTVPTGSFAAAGRRPGPLLAAVAANALLPLLLLPALAATVSWLPGSEGLIAGLALVAAMPVAAGATVYGARAGADPALTVAAVLCSTALSPLVIPLTLAEGARLTSGDSAEDLGDLMSVGTGPFAVLNVVAPCVLGLAARRLVAGRATGALRWAKAASLGATVLLTYINGSGLPKAVLAGPDAVLFAADVLLAAALCGASLACGWALSRARGLDPGDTAAVTIAAGMNNSSASAVLAATHLSDHPQVLLPILAYGLLQALLAGAADWALRRRRDAAYP
ncbi:bile acid:sodium symporter family protein [Streptomyces olivoreticuli]|uniref:bile acid:sodium symporter family protein n=1 Tax=Streptomyces olivoreticuli TaxID=68246 RepID=UPI000E23205A|nr:sodium-dependent transporter [Streptomyces olivoreticuli]